MWKTPELSKNIEFKNLTSENELNLSKLKGNLKEKCKFITPDIFLDENSIIIDVGANIGKYTSLFARYNCIVYSFEPTKKTFEVLEKRFKLKDNVICYNKACGIKNKKVNLYHHELSDYNQIYWSTGNSLLKSKTNVLENNFEIVDCINFSDFVFSKTKNKNIDLIKMDIEGFEIDLINHLIDTNAISKINYLICETHEKKNKFLLEKTALLKQKVKNKKLNNKIYFNWI